MAQARGDAGLSGDEAGRAPGNLGLTQNLFAIWNTRDFEGLIPLVADDLEWVPQTMSAVEGSSFRGVDGLREFFGEWDSTWATWEVEPNEVKDLGDHVLVLGKVHAEARSSGLELDQPVAYLFEFREGLLAYGATFFDHNEARNAARARGALEAL